MNRCRYTFWLLLALIVMPALAKDEKPQQPQEPPPYNQQMNVVFADTDDGVGLIMDIFTPKGKKNGLGIIDVVSGSWSSARGRLEDHKRAKMFDIICGRGYTVFAIRPGSVSKYTALEMLSNLKTGIRWVKAHAQDYGIDPDRLGIAGASAGGHLASLAITTAEDGNPKAKDELDRYDTRVKAAVIFFPPTDFLEWGDVKVKEGQTSPVLLVMGKLVYSGGTKGRTPEQINRQLEKISPARLVTGKEPPCLIIHGDADPLVPLQQSQKLVDALKKAGASAELIVKPGGGHPWPTINEEIAIAADWLDRQLHRAASDANRNDEKAKQQAAAQ
jgi:acetyl esterase/lipase